MSRQKDPLERRSGAGEVRQKKFHCGTFRNGIRLLVSSLLVTAGLATAALTQTGSPASAASVPSSQGTDFWLAFTSNVDPGNLYLFISGDTATTGTVSDAAIGFSQTFSVTPGVSTTITVPTGAEIDSSDTTVTGGALHVTAAAPVSAYGLNTYPATTDGFLGLPTPILGTSYLTQDYTGAGGALYAVVGTQNGTVVTITPSATTGPYTAGVPYTVNLNQGDVYQYIDDSGVDLAGSSITSNLPIATFAGNSCGDIPVGYSYCNVLTEEMTPTDTWGTDFLTEPFATRSGDTFRVMASEDNTNVDINGTQVATLNAGKYYETILTSASTVTANNPVQLMQYSNGETYDNANADPFMVTIPPTEQFLNSYTVSAEPADADQSITQNYLNIVAPTAEVGGITLDGSLLPASDFAAIAGSSYSGAQVAVDFGSHTISASLPFGLTVYGYGGYDGYGYPGGFTLSPIATVTHVSLAPTSSSFTVGSSACETATVTDQNNDPVSGVRVDFTVTGVNPTSGFLYSASDGTAQFCYTGSNAGSDTEGAAVGAVSSNSASIGWASSSPKPTSVSTSLSGGGQSGTSISVPTGTAVIDTATLSGTNASTATGTVTYNVYSDSGCTTLAPGGGGTPETITKAGTLPASSPITLSNAGTYYWDAVYSGDTTNATSTSTCGTAASGGEVETVTPPAPQPTSVSTSLSGGGQSGTSISVPTGTAVIDTATLSGTNASTATGTVTYNVYSDSGCTTLAPGGGGTPETITKAGTLPASSPITLSNAGTYYWDAVYSGDTTNATSTSTCGTAASGGEVETVTPPAPQPTSVSTSLSGGGQSGTSISVPTGTAVTDTATLSGTNASTATGTVSYNVYSDAACSTLVSGGTPETITDPGTLPASSPITLSNAGTYYWDAVYSGDTTNATSTSTCGTAASGGEVETVTGTTTAQPTKLKTSLSGKGTFGGGKCWWIGDLISVFAGTPVTDTATLSGANAAKATGNVTYTVYSWVPASRFSFGKWKMVASGGTFPVSAGSVPTSNPVTLPLGTYEWQATYSGDALNSPSSSKFGSETEIVIPAPHCSYGWNFGLNGGCKPCPKAR